MKLHEFHTLLACTYTVEGRGALTYLKFLTVALRNSRVVLTVLRLRQGAKIVLGKGRHDLGSVTLQLDREISIVGEPGVSREVCLLSPLVHSGSPFWGRREGGGGR